MENNWYAQFGCNLISEQSLDAREGYKKKKKFSFFKYLRTRHHIKLFKILIIIGKSIETERFLLPGSGGGKNGTWLLVGKAFLLGVVKCSRI